MPDFTDQKLDGSRFDRVDLSRSTFQDVDLSGSEVRDAMLHRVRMRGVELWDVEIDGELNNVVVNGVDVGPLVEAELDRRDPERALMRPDDPDGFRRAWAVLERRWEETVARARTFPESELHRSVDDEWSFIQTLRHLGFATAAWLGRMVLGESDPWHPLDLPWDGAAGWEGIPWDRAARPSLEEALAVRRSRQAQVREFLAELSDDRLADHVTRTDPGFPQEEDFPVRECLRVILNEEWHHRLFAERDLTKLQKET